MDKLQNIDQAGVVNTELPIAEHDVAVPPKAAQQISVTLYKIDEIILDYLKNVIKPTVTENGQTIPVPVLIGNPERWVSVRKDGFIRDPKSSKVQLPLIMLRRSSISRNPLTSPVNKFLDKVFETGWNPHNSYDRFNAVNHIIPSKEIVKVTIPDYVDLTYEVLAWTEYDSQINELIEQINFEVDEFWGRRNGFKFRVYVQDYNQQNDLPPTDNRLVRASFNMVVKGYLLPLKAQLGDAGPISTSQHATTQKVKVVFTKIGEPKSH